MSPARSGELANADLANAAQFRAVRTVQVFEDNTEKIGAGDEIRTHDPNLGKVMLYP